MYHRCTSRWLVCLSVILLLAARIGSTGPLTLA